ncbi:MAG: hypothetical protein QXW10_01050 [Candidatus Micrarchaeaceae archaeon]
MEKNRSDMSKKVRGSAKSGPVFIVKSASRMGGLDYLHITLIALVILLVIVAFALSIFKQGVVLENCPYGIVNDTCAHAPSSNSIAEANVIKAVGSIIAGYQNSSSSLSILPYYSLINESKVYYIQANGTWLVTVPYLDPFENGTEYNISMVLYKNLTLDNIFLSTARPVISSNYSTVAFGTVDLTNKYMCNYSTPIPVYLITDPYAPGAISAIDRAINISAQYAGKVDMNYYFVFSDYSINMYKQYGVSATQRLGDYLVCASHQPEFKQFMGDLSSIDTSIPQSSSVLYSIVQASGMNTTSFDGCLANVSEPLDAQAQFAALYKLNVLPSFIVNCKYQTLPQTLDSAINYTLSKVNQTK